jgi:hypothetical protein
MTRTALICLFSAASLGVLLLPSPARAQVTPAPTPTPPAQPAAAPAAPAVEPPIGENYRFEVSAGIWPTMPSTMLYSDTESVTPSGSTTATTVTGTNIDFKQQLGLKNQTFAEFHLVIRPMPKHKIHLDFVPLYYKQSATLATALNFNGQSYLAGETVSSSLYWNSWQLAYEYDPLTFDRGYIGGMVALNYYAVRGELSSGTQAGGAGVHIPMPGLGVIGRYYVAPRVSLTASLTGYDLPGGATSTHGHVIDVNGYATINVSKFVGIQGGYRSFDASHVWSSPLNTGSFTIQGPFIGGTFRY